MGPSKGPALSGPPVTGAERVARGWVEMGYTSGCSMPDSDGPRGPLEALRNAARGGQERFLVALSDRLERSRIAGALTSEGFVLESDSLSDALARLADESFDLAILDLPTERLDIEPG